MCRAVCVCVFVCDNYINNAVEHLAALVRVFISAVNTVTCIHCKHTATHRNVFSIKHSRTCMGSHIEHTYIHTFGLYLALSVFPPVLSIDYFSPVGLFKRSLGPSCPRKWGHISYASTTRLHVHHSHKCYCPVPCKWNTAVFFYRKMYFSGEFRLPAAVKRHCFNFDR